MRGRAFTIVLAACAIVAALTGVGASAEAPLPDCAPSDQALSVETPPYDRVGRLLLIDYSVAPELGTVADLTVLMNGRGTEQRPLQEDGQFGFALPREPGRARLTFTWRQTLPSGFSCRARVSDVVDVLGKSVRVGDPEFPRLTGRYRVVFHARNYRSTTLRRTWTLTPRCDRYACSVRRRSNGGGRGIFYYQGDGTWKIVGPWTGLPRSYCRTTLGGVETGRWYGTLRSRYVATITSVTGKRIATGFTARWAEEYRTTPRSRAHGCYDTPEPRYDSVRGRRVR